MNSVIVSVPTLRDDFAVIVALDGSDGAHRENAFSALYICLPLPLPFLSIVPAGKAEYIPPFRILSHLLYIRYL